MNAVAAPGVVSAREQVEVPADLAVRAPVDGGGQKPPLGFVEGAYGVIFPQEALEESRLQAVVDKAEAVDGRADIEEEAVDAALLEIDDGLQPV